MPMSQNILFFYNCMNKTFLMEKYEPILAYHSRPKKKFRVPLLSLKKFGIQ